MASCDIIFHNSKKLLGKWMDPVKCIIEEWKNTYHLKLEEIA